MHVEALNKIHVVEDERHRFWTHYRAHVGHHPAIDVHDQNPHSRWHQPLGFSGDDARYTLAGRKIIIMQLNFILQRVESCFFSRAHFCDFNLFITRPTYCIFPNAVLIYMLRFGPLSIPLLCAALRSKFGA